MPVWHASHTFDVKTNSPERYNEALEPPLLAHRLFRRLDTGYLKPIFGGNGSCLP